MIKEVETKKDTFQKFISNNYVLDFKVDLIGYVVAGFWREEALQVPRRKKERENLDVDTEKISHTLNI